jgi:hypothetical protein
MTATRRKRDDGWGPLAAGAAAGLCGYRLELALVMVVVVAHALIARVVGGVAVWVLLAVLVAGLLAVGPVRRWLGRALPAVASGVEGRRA